MSISRPDRGETDDDILRLQEEFLAKKEKPSVNIKKVAVGPCSMAQESTGHPNAPVTVGEFKPKPVMLANDSADNNPTSFISSQSEVSTDSFVTPKWITDPNVMSDSVRATPSSVKLEDTKAGPPKRKSLFALRMEQSRAEANNTAGAANVILKGRGSVFGEKSYIVSGKEAADVHKQNVAQLEMLSAQEIEQERQRLMSQLSSSTIKFLQSRRQATKTLQPEMETLSLDSEHELNTKPFKRDNAHPICANPLERKKVFSTYVTSQNKEISEGENEDLLATLPINPNETKQWLHMDVVEKEKLAWMKDLPPVKKVPGPDEPYAARFDFQGLLLPYNDENLEVNKGLHHHGDEPERPGYTLQELMQLSRSSVQQQRIIGLNTLGNVLLKAKMGIYDKVLQENIIKELLDAGIFLLLRFSMDDPSPPVMIAAVTAMKNLLFNELDETSLDYFLGCEGGLQHPLLDVPYEENDSKKIQEQIEHEAELKDFEIIQLDVLRGAQRTNLILRLGYILDVIKGPPDVVLDLLLRISRHSREFAESVASCGGLLRTIRDQLLTTQVIPSLVAGFGQPGYGEPSSKALRLMRVLAAHSRVLANTLLDKFNVMEPVMTYVSMSSPELPHIQGLVIHGFYLWQTFLCYGLASQSITDLFPILMRQLHFHAQVTSAIGEESSSSGHELATALAGVVERSCDIVMSDPGVLEAKHVFQLAHLVVDCLHKWLTQLSSLSSETPSWSCVKMVGSALNCLATTLLCAKNLDLKDSRSSLEKLESFLHTTIITFLKSSCLQKLLENLLPSSYFLSDGEAGSKRDPPNLPSLGAMEWGGEKLVPGLLPQAPHPLLSGLLRFLATSYEIFGSSSTKLQSLLLDSTALNEYIVALISVPIRSSSHWFCRQEVYMLHHLLVLIVLQPSLVPEENKHKYAQLALRVIDLIQANDKYMISHLLPITIFNADFMKWGLNSCPLEELLNNNLLKDSLKKLSSIGSLYLNMLGVRFLKVPSPHQRTSLTSISKGTEPALPVDWHFAPLLVLYGQYNAQNRARCSESGITSTVTETLQFLFLTETIWPKSRRPLTVTARWCRLALIFLAGSDLFLDNDVRKYLRVTLDQLLTQSKKLDFSEDIPGLSSFYDLYGELLLQYSAVSYGDELFGAFLLLPLQQKQDPQLRRMIWGENAVVLRMLSTPIEEVGVPLEEYLEPCETDPSLLSCYLEAIGKGEITEKRCPVLFRVALHHVATFVQQYKNHPFAAALRKGIERLGNKDLQELFVKYQAPVSQQK